MKFAGSAVFSVLLTISSFVKAAEPDIADPLAPILRPVLQSSVKTLLETHRQKQKYQESQFPLPPDKFGAFQKEVIGALTKSLQLEDWVVRNPQGKQNALQGLFKDVLLKKIRHHDVELEVHLIEIPQTGARVPAVVCLPAGDKVHAGVCVFSGHTKHGLRDLVLDLESYQSGIAVRLAQAGFVTIAVEKIDTGYLSRGFTSGVDEEQIATLRLAIGRVTRSHQLMACLAASEILAMHPRVDPERIGATGVSLGGWLSVETALLSDRISAVADFGRKTMNCPSGITENNFAGMRDLCHIMPGLMSVCDRNLHALAYAPRPMLAGHGKADTGSHEQAVAHFKPVFEKQYDALGEAGQYQYHIHSGGDTMPGQAVIEYFSQVFDEN